MSPPPANAATAPDPLGAGMEPARQSLSESFRTVAVPLGRGQFWRKLGAFAGPGYLVAVG